MIEHWLDQYDPNILGLGDHCSVTFFCSEYVMDLKLSFWKKLRLSIANNLWGQKFRNEFLYNMGTNAVSKMWNSLGNQAWNSQISDPQIHTTCYIQLYFLWKHAHHIFMTRIQIHKHKFWKCVKHGQINISIRATQGANLRFHPILWGA